MYDIVFISYNEVEADINWRTLKDKFPYAMRVHGVKGIHQAHITAANLAKTPMVYIVDADAIIINDFDFKYVPPRSERDYVHVWRSQNPINDLVYGYGGVKLFPRLETVNMDTSKPDMTTSISPKFKLMQDVSNIAAFNVDEFSTWRSAFRECCKLASAVIDRQKQDETDIRLSTWCNATGRDRPFGDYAIQGARQGRKYGVANQGNIEALKMINDFKWLEEKFNATID